MKYCNFDPNLKKHISLTFDIDWAPDFTIQFVLNLLEDTKATMFFTHDTPIIEKIRGEHKNIELAYHPNFFPGSTQGKTENEIMAYGKKLIKGLKGIRTHRLLNSSRHYELYAQSNIKYDSSLIMFKVPYLIPYLDHNRILRIPIFWEDDANAVSGAIWDDVDVLLQLPGLKVFNFHPLYLYMAISSFSPYLELKTCLDAKGGRLSECTEKQIAPYINKGDNGNLFFFKDLLAKIKAQEFSAYRLEELTNCWRSFP